MHIKPSWISGLLVAVLLPVTTSLGAATPLVDRLPINTVAYLGWPGTDALQPAYDKSHLKVMVDDSNLPSVVIKELPRLRAMAEKHGDSGGKKFDAAEKALKIVLRHPGCVFVNMVEHNSLMPYAEVGMLVNAGDDSSELQKDLVSPQFADTQDNVQVGSLDHLVWIGGGSKLPFEPLHGGKKALSANPRFIAAQKQLSFVASPVISLYVDLKAARKLADRVAQELVSRDAKQDEQPNQYWPGVRDALGLTNLKSFSMDAGFVGANWGSEAFLAAPSPRTGLLAVIEPKPIDRTLLSHVSPNTSDISATNFDAAKLFDTVKKAVSVTPQGADLFGKATGAADLFVGCNIRDQLLAQLGSQWVTQFVSDDPKSFEVINQVSDPKTLQRALTSVTYTLSNTLNLKLPAQPDGTPGSVASQKKLDGLTVTSFTTKYGGASWAIQDSMLAIGASPETLAKGFAAIKNNTTPSTHGLDAAKKTLNPPSSATVGGFSFSDLRESAPGMYKREGVAFGLGKETLQRMAKINLPDIQLPTLAQIMPELSPAVSIDWADSDGISSRSENPFPGSELLAQSAGSGKVSIGAVALGTSILLPSLNRARETANRVKSASNERQIGQAILMYGNKHRGRYPNTLGELINTEDIFDQAFISPMRNTKLPIGLTTPKQKSDWVNQHADYVYVGKGLTNNSAQADTVVLFEKPAATDADGMNVLYGDGHVDWVKRQKAAKIRAEHPAP